MNTPIQKVNIHPDYLLKKENILKCISRFNNDGTVILNGKRNVIKSFDLDQDKINIKGFKSPNFINAFVYKFIRKSKAKRSFEYAQKLIDYGISTPFPIAYIEVFSLMGLKESYYVSKHIDYDFDFRALIHNSKFPQRETILEQFTDFTFKLHENNINFLDHSPGNTLIVKRGSVDYDFYLIDLNRMVFEPMDFDKRMHNFRRLWLSKTMIKIISKAYAKRYGKSIEEVYTLMLKHSRAFQKDILIKKLRRQKRAPKFGK